MTQTLTKFKQVYADAVIPPDEWTEEKGDQAMNERQLTWQGERVPLAEAAEAYACIIGYNEFKPNMLMDLSEEYPDAGIEVTPAREYSVGVYLHIPDLSGVLCAEVEKWVKEKWNADDVNWVDGSNTLHVWWD